MLKLLNHYTLNTYNLKVSYPPEIGTKVHCSLQNMIKEAKNGELVEIYPNIRMKLTVDNEKGCYICTLHLPDETPTLLTAGCNNKDYAAEFFNEINETYEGIYKRKSKIVPMFPYILDMIFPVPENYKNMFKWTADFCKCLAWQILSPESIR